MQIYTFLRFIASVILKINSDAIKLILGFYGVNKFINSVLRNFFAMLSSTFSFSSSVSRPA